MDKSGVIKYFGSCHCGAVKFAAYAPIHLSVVECNCSICYKSGFLHLHVKNEDFTLLCGEEYLVAYLFNTKQVRHTFCKICGIKPFYRPIAYPEDYTINVRCLDTEGKPNIEITPFNGKNPE